MVHTVLRKKEIIWLKLVELKYNLQLNFEKKKIISTRKNLLFALAIESIVERHFPGNKIWFNWKQKQEKKSFSHFASQKQLRELRFYLFIYSYLYENVLHDLIFSNSQQYLVNYSFNIAREKKKAQCCHIIN